MVCLLVRAVDEIKNGVAAQVFAIFSGHTMIKLHHGDSFIFDSILVGLFRIVVHCLPPRRGPRM